MPENTFEEQNIEDIRQNGPWESRENDEVKSFESRVADLIVPDNSTEREYEWVLSNIESINNVVQSGRHDLLYYPASGRDFLRVIAAYNTIHLITVDTEPNFIEEIEKQLKSLDIEYQIKTKTSEKVEFTFEINGKPRTITHLIGDARTQTLSTLGLETVDILHVFLPTGADQDIRADEEYMKAKYGKDWYSKIWDQSAKELMEADPNAPKKNPKSGEYQIVIPAVPKTLESSSYQKVNEGGFLVFGEKKLQHGITLASIYNLAGLKEYKITRRHPYTVLTSLFPSKEELANMDWDGYIYQKEKTVKPEIIDIVNEILMDQFWTEYSFMEFERGNFEYMGMKKGAPIDVEASFQQQYQDLQVSVTEFMKQLLSAGASQTEVDAFKLERLSEFQRRTKSLQQSAVDLLKTYEDVSKKYESGELDDKAAYSQMGIGASIDSVGTLVHINKKYPLAVQLVMSSQEKGEEVEEVLNQLSKMNLNFE